MEGVRGCDMISVRLVFSDYAGSVVLLINSTSELQRTKECIMVMYMCLLQKSDAYKLTTTRYIIDYLIVDAYGWRSMRA